MDELGERRRKKELTDALAIVADLRDVYFFDSDLMGYPLKFLSGYTLSQLLRARLMVLDAAPKDKIPLLPTPLKTRQLHAKYGGK